MQVEIKIDDSYIDPKIIILTFWNFRFHFCIDMGNDVSYRKKQCKEIE